MKNLRNPDPYWMELMRWQAKCDALEKELARTRESTGYWMRAVIEELAKVRDAMVDLKPSRGRMIVIDKKTGKPKAPDKTPAPLRKGKQAQAKRKAKQWAAAGRKTT